MLDRKRAPAGLGQGEEVGRLPRSLRRKFGKTHRFGCESGKRRYFDYGTAYLEMLAITERMKRHGEERFPQNIYRCEWCAGFHLTSKRSSP